MMKNKKKNKDILKRPCPKPEDQIPEDDRAVQFMSFEALKGFDEEIDETAKKERETETVSEFDKYNQD